MKRILVLVAGLTLATSCFTVVHDYEGPREVTPGTKLSQASVKVGRVSTHKKAKFLFWGLVNINTVSGAQMTEEFAVENHGEDFDGLTRVRIHEEQTPVDVIVEILTLGIFSMLTVEAEAEIHRYEGGGA